MKRCIHHNSFQDDTVFRNESVLVLGETEFSALALEESIQEIGFTASGVFLLNTKGSLLLKHPMSTAWATLSTTLKFTHLLTSIAGSYCMVRSDDGTFFLWKTEKTSTIQLDAAKVIQQLQGRSIIQMSAGVSYW